MTTEIAFLTEGLNDAQHQAVTAPLGNILVLAGAGSGKTRVLTHRIAWLLKTQHFSPFNILAVTFTNKAANEMRGRLESLLGFATQNLWVGTFHGIAHRLLRIHWQEAGLNENFQIMDSDDQYRAIRRIITAMGLDEKQWAPKQIQWFINNKKDEGLRGQAIQDTGDLHLGTLIRIYQQYEEMCQRSGVVDFAELMLRAYELWQSRPDILSHYQERFKYILVDEFQDTNAIQRKWIMALVKDKEKGKLMAVGDDDQSIYGWRGAKGIENMQALETELAALQIIRLEQNYRSTGNILHAANTLIARNADRLGKNLWTQDEKGELISLYAAFNEIDEARFIIDRIRDYYKKNHTYAECAILYRSNAQSRVLEEVLIQAGIPYRIYGGLRFFERAEIKDALCYLRLIANRDDDSAFERVINMPARGIGEQTLNLLRQTAREQHISLWQSALRLVEQQQCAARTLNAVQQFLCLIENLHQEIAHLSLSELTEHTLHATKLLSHYQNEKGEKGQNRVENLQELISATKQFQDEASHTEEMSALSAFLATAALEAGEIQSEAASDYVQLMTLHSAKGLEFPTVFLAGLEEGLFPHQLSIEEPQKLMEERRLCYVGMTRAMKKLYLSYAETRRLYGNETYHRPSRFIRELPSDILQEVRLRTQVTRPLYNSNVKLHSRHKTALHETLPGDAGLRLGQRVKHPVFGEGVVLNYEGQGPSARVQVKFLQAGAKWLVAAYAKLEVL